MLVLSRRPGEQIVVNGDIRITVVSVKGDRVRLGIEAPSHVPVDRAEVHARRMEFHEVEMPVPAGHADDEVPLGVVTHRSADDTMRH